METTIYTQTIEREDTSGESDVSFNRDKLDNLCLSDNSDDNDRMMDSNLFAAEDRDRCDKRYKIPTPLPRREDGHNTRRDQTRDRIDGRGEPSRRESRIKMERKRREDPLTI